MNDTIRSLKDQWDIVSEIGRVVSLIKRGQNYVGLCPFHSEKSPSFYVIPRKKFFHCFGCGESGDVIDFAMKYENVSFREVVAEKAKLFNLPDQFSSSSEGASELDALRDFLRTLQAQYSQWLMASASAQDYLNQRAIVKASWQTFSLGYAPDATTQMAWLHQIGGVAIAHKSGLFKSDGFPLLRERIVFTIHNATGIIAGFSGRVWGQSDQAKYVNSPESVVFSKKKILYGFHHAKQSIKHAQNAIIVEGYTDVIALHQNGFSNAIGVMGTALTEYHAKQIRSYTTQVTLWFDSDEAGYKAVIRSLESLIHQGLTVRVVTVDGKDPADFLLKNSKETCQKVVDHAPFYMDYLIKRVATPTVMANSTEKSKAIAFLCQILAKDGDAVVKEDYIKRIAHQFSVSARALESYMIAPYTDTVQKGMVQQPESKYKKAEAIVLFLLITQLDFRNQYLEPLREVIPLLDDAAIFDVFRLSTQVDYDIVNQINHSEARSFLMSLLVKFEGMDFNPSLEEKEAYAKLLIDVKYTKRINDIRALLGSAQGDQETKLLVELSELVKKIK
jgi:DNA primase